MKEYTIEDFERLLLVYTDIVKYKKKSKMIDEAWDCLKVMEYFEEYEKCLDLIPFIERGSQIPRANMGEMENN